jgi:tetratricopeptide (TPR) repeat protein
MYDCCLRLLPSRRNGYQLELVVETQQAPVLCAETPAVDVPSLQQNYLRSLQHTSHRDYPVSLLREFGLKLGEVLFPSPVLQVLRQWLAQDEVLLRLDTEAVPRLSALPWEYSFVEGEGFLCLHPRLHLARQVANTGHRVPVSPEDEIIVLVVWANPATAAYPALRHVDREVEAIRSVFDDLLPGRARVELLPHASPGALEARLSTPPSPHILHFIGHGDTRPSGCFLVLQGTQPHTESILYADDLVSWLQPGSVQLGVLSACFSAGTEHGIAESLARGGIAAVVAMQMSVRDEIAPQFAHVFYQSLRSTGTVVTAVSEARRALRTAGVDWGVPVLHTRPGPPVLFYPFSAPIAPPPVSVFGIPAHNRVFVGRQQLIAQVRRALQHSRRVALTGLPGIGKSQAAAEFARTCTSQFPGGVYWLNATDTQRLIEGYAVLPGSSDGLSAYLSTHERATLVKEKLEQVSSPTLVVLDNVTEHTEQAWIPEGEFCHVLVTTRHPYLVKNRFRVLPVSSLEAEAAQLLLQSRQQAQDEVDVLAAQEIAQLMDYHPLALSLIAAYVERAHISFHECLQRLGDTRQRLDMLQRARFTFSPSDGDDALTDSLTATLHALSPQTRQVLEAACVLGNRPVPMILLHQICEPLSVEQVEEAVDEMCDLALVTRTAEQQLCFHDLVRSLVREQCEPARAMRYRHSAIRQINERLHKANARKDWSGLADDFVHARSLLHDTARLPPSEGWLALSEALALALMEHSRNEEACQVLEEALAKTRDLETDSPLHEAAFMRLLGFAYEKARVPDKARHFALCALSSAEQCLPANSPQLIEYLTVAGYVLKMTSSLPEAQQHYERALHLARTAYGDDHPYVATILNNLGTLHEARGEFCVAMDRLQESLHIDEQLYGRSHFRIAIRLNNMGRVCAAMGDPLQAVRLHEEAAIIYEKSFGSDSPDVGDSLGFLGDALLRAGDREGARAAFSRSLGIYERAYFPHHPDCQGMRRRLAALQEEKA